MDLLDGMYGLQVLRDFKKTGDAAWVAIPLLVLCVTQHNVRPIVDTKALKLSSMSNKAISSVRRIFFLLR